MKRIVIIEAERGLTISTLSETENNTVFGKQDSFEVTNPYIFEEKVFVNNEIKQLPQKVKHRKKRKFHS